MASAATCHAVKGKVIVVTGSSDGIGARLSQRLAGAGARVILVARSLDKLKVVRDSIRDQGGEAYEYIANLSVLKECEHVMESILADHGRVDILVSNAGRSIRRSVKYQCKDRFHDFQRIFALNFFGALRLILGVLPGMIEQKNGHIIHISSFAVPTRQSRFAGYAASKAAMDALLQSLASEVASVGVRTSSVYMPLVATKMASGGHGGSYDHFTMLSTDEACQMIEKAIVTKEQDTMDVKSRWMAYVYFFMPFLMTALNARIYQLERETPPDDVASKINEKVEKPKAPKNAKTHLKALGTFLKLVSAAEPVLQRLFVYILSPSMAVMFALWIFFQDLGRAAVPHCHAILALNVQVPLCTLVLILWLTSRPHSAVTLAVANILALLPAFYLRHVADEEDEQPTGERAATLPQMRRMRRLLKMSTNATLCRSRTGSSAGSPMRTPRFAKKSFKKNYNRGTTTAVAIQEVDAETEELDKEGVPKQNSAPALTSM